jgi:acetyl esterase/lipase
VCGSDQAKRARRPIWKVGSIAEAKTIVLLAILTYLSALLGIAPFVRLRDRSAEPLLWLPKLLGGALSLVAGVVGGLGALVGIARRDFKLAAAGVLGAGLAAKYVAGIPASEDQFEAAFGPGWQERVPLSLRPLPPLPRWTLRSRAPGAVRFQRNVVFGHRPGNSQALLADLWQPSLNTPPSGLGIIYAHGSGWRVGDKDLGTRPFFRRLAGQGHVVLDIAYTLWPQADIPTMVAEVNQAILWLKENGPAYSVNPERVVLSGGSAGAHLALLAAYTANHPAFRPAAGTGDTSVRGVVAFYPPVDFLATRAQMEEQRPASPGFLSKAGEAIMNSVFELQNWDAQREAGRHVRYREAMVAMMGGDVDEVPDTYRLLSPASHVGPHCPPTLLLQGSDDVFGLAPPLRRFHEDLLAAGVPVILVEFPHTEHGFDLVLPQVSPVARAAIVDVERFLALLV